MGPIGPELAVFKRVDKAPRKGQEPVQGSLPVESVPRPVRSGRTKFSLDNAFKGAWNNE